MANIIINSRFNPFSYLELIQPSLMATQLHLEIQAKLSDLATQSNVWESLANSAIDKDVYSQYKNYANDLKSRIDELLYRGLNPNSLQDMLDMRNRYSKEITPIETAYKRRLELVDELRKLLALDKSSLFNINASNIKLRDLIDNPSTSYKMISGNELMKDVGIAALALSKEVRENPRKWRSILGNSYYETMLLRGFKSDEVLLAIMRNENAPKVLTELVDKVVDSSGVASWNDIDALNRARDFASRGLYQAIGDTQYLTLDNWQLRMAMQRNAMLEVAQLPIQPNLLREVKGVKINDISTSLIQEDISKLLGTYKPNGDLRNKNNNSFLDKIIINLSPSSFGPLMNRISKVNEDRLKLRVRDKYSYLSKDNKSLSDLLLVKLMLNEIKKSQENLIGYSMNTNNPEYVTNYILDGIKLRAGLTKELGIKDVSKEGESMMPIKYFGEHFDKDSQFIISPVHGPTLVSLKGDKPIIAKLPLDLFDDNVRSFWHNYKELYSQEHYNEAKQLLIGMSEYLALMLRSSIDFKREFKDKELGGISNSSYDSHYVSSYGENYE